MCFLRPSILYGEVVIMQTENIQKYENYKEQFKRLNKAIDNKFYLEALFISYAIIEDRSEAILSYEGNEINSKNFVSINKKLIKIKKLAEQKKTLPQKYFSDSLIDDILAWKEVRNGLIHSLMKQSLTTEELEKAAEDGRRLARELSNRATNYKRAVGRRSK